MNLSSFTMIAKWGVCGYITSRPGEGRHKGATDRHEKEAERLSRITTA